MSKIGTLLGMASLVLATALHAQTKPTQDPAVQQQRMAARSETVTRQLGLDEKQQVLMKEADERYTSALETLRANREPGEETTRMHQEIREKHLAELKAFLSEDQYAKYVSLYTPRAIATAPAPQPAAVE